MAELLGPRGEPIGETLVTQLQESLQTATFDRRVAERDAEYLAYHVLNMSAGADRPDKPSRDRIKIARAATDVWEKDPQAGAAIDLLNDFVFGRGVPRPRAKDPEVQKVLDEAWDDPDNRLVLTSYEALIAKGTDLQLQANVFFLAFEAEDGRVKLALLDHDAVEDVVRDPDNRLRILYFKTRETRREWDFEKDQEKPVDLISGDGKPKVKYYEHHENVRDAKGRPTFLPEPPEEKRGKGRVYHVSINKRSEQAFGVSPMARLLRWFSAYNEFMTSRVDVVKAVAAFVMKRKVRGGEAAVQRIAQQRLNRQSELASASPDLDQLVPPAPASILNENDGVSHEALNLSSNAGNALQDGQMLRSQVSAATRFPQHYLGDAGSANLATATAMELPVLKAVEARQEVWEGVFRWFIERVIDRAVETGRLSRDRGDLAEAADRAGEEETERDLGYEFSLPSPLKRMLADYINALANTAKTFDPNGTNLELTRFLLTLALREGFEIEDAASAVEAIFPEGYEDPLMKAQREQAEAAAEGQADATRGEPGKQPNQTNPYGGESQESPNTPNRAGSSPNPYGANRGTRSRRPEEVKEARFSDLPPEARERVDARAREWEDELDREVFAGIADLLEDPARDAHTNGKG